MGKPDLSPEAFEEFVSASVKPQCRTCTSEHRDSIDAFLLAGRPVATVARFLKTKDIVISEDALRRHLRDHLDG